MRDNFNNLSDSWDIDTAGCIFCSISLLFCNYLRLNWVFLQAKYHPYHPNKHDNFIHIPPTVRVFNHCWNITGKLQQVCHSLDTFIINRVQYTVQIISPNQNTVTIMTHVSAYFAKITQWQFHNSTKSNMVFRYCWCNNRVTVTSLSEPLWNCHCVIITISMLLMCKLASMHL